MAIQITNYWSVALHYIITEWFADETYSTTIVGRNKGTTLKQVKNVAALIRYERDTVMNITAGGGPKMVLQQYNLGGNWRALSVRDVDNEQKRLDFERRQLDLLASGPGYIDLD